ncbi:hypothetical protein B9Z55_017079 [Caenorhabditis nigoni]|uniref:Uncharacterized protein n=1 Tax=Caenorhabditis nigoni TaxID=1611254 RepID=A0A2G5T7Y8_9PELO|nr:hypothetical protein B9Z55_017079 [Caenorhabditis nigoni]
MKPRSNSLRLLIFQRVPPPPPSSCYCHQQFVMFLPLPTSTYCNNVSPDDIAAAAAAENYALTPLSFFNLYPFSHRKALIHFRWNNCRRMVPCCLLLAVVPGPGTASTATSYFL